jgi:molybdopterin-guanine dinucleotide biosynthesis protein B
MPPTLPIKAFGFAGYSGAGKTTLIEAIIPRLTRHGLRISLIKHTHHDFDLDQPGKDSFRHRAAGAGEVMLVCDQRWAILHELRGAPEPPLEAQLRLLAPCDLVLVEGYKYTPIPKLEVYRASCAKPFIWPHNDDVVAIASDVALSVPLPVVHIDDHDALAALVLQQTGLMP